MSTKSGSKAPADAGVDLSSLRRSVTGESLTRDDLVDDPLRQFESWFKTACDAQPLDPNAMGLATVDADGRPALRTVLLKYFDERGLVFFTNLSSSKAQQISANANVALLLYWPELARQVSIRGSASKLPNAETLRYFVTRPRGSQIGAWVSTQSSVITSRAVLETKFEELKRKFRNREVPLPSFWGGYRVAPVEFEFWQGRRNRLHDRFRYALNADGSWTIERLAP